MRAIGVYDLGMSQVEGVRPAWIRRFHRDNLIGLGMRYVVEDGVLIVEKLGIRRQANLDDEESVWKILTNDMELGEETAILFEEILYRIVLVEKLVC